MQHTHLLYRSPCKFSILGVCHEEKYLKSHGHMTDVPLKEMPVVTSRGALAALPIVSQGKLEAWCSIFPEREGSPHTPAVFHESAEHTRGRRQSCCQTQSVQSLPWGKAVPSRHVGATMLFNRADNFCSTRNVTCEDTHSNKQSDTVRFAMLQRIKQRKHSLGSITASDVVCEVCSVWCKALCRSCHITRRRWSPLVRAVSAMHLSFTLSFCG